MRSRPAFSGATMLTAIDQSDPLSAISDPRLLAQAIVDTIREPLLVLDSKLRVIAASRAFYTTFALDRSEVGGRAVYALGAGQWDIPGLRLLLEEILPRHTVMEAYEVVGDFAGLGARTMLLNARRIVEHGDAQQMILLAIEDITARRTAERVAADLLRQKEILLQEVPHRVANSLQIIASILSLKAQTVESDDVRLHLEDANRRVLSVAAVQRQLRVSGNLERIEMAPYLRSLCAALTQSMIGAADALTIEVHAGPDTGGGTATSTGAVSLGLIVTELVINSLKHAFPGGTKGGAISVVYEGDAQWRLTVSDNGVGRRDDAAPGLGTSIVEALAAQVDATVTVAASNKGTQTSIVHAPA